MLSEHNPIAELVHQIQKKWIDEVSSIPELKLVRWIIKPDEARLFEGFLKLESTEHGAIPEVVVAIMSPFKSEFIHSKTLVCDWIGEFKEDKKTKEKLIAKGMNNTWSSDVFLMDTVSSDAYAHDDLLKMLSSFQVRLMDKNMRLVVALFPYSIYDMSGYNRWLISLLKQQIPDKISFMIFDHIGENYFDGVFRKYPDITKSLHVNLDLDGAISKIAKMGDPNSPEVKLRECMLEMGKAVQNKDQSRLHEWGEKALQVTQKSPLKSVYASAHIIYAGMLFNFKQYEKIDHLLAQGLNITNKGLKLDDGACKPLMIQYYGFIAASRQLQKRMTEAIQAYEKQGDLAVEYQLPGVAITPYRQAYSLSKKKLPERYDDLINKTFLVGMTMQKEEQQNSSFPGVAYDYLQWVETRKGWKEAKQAELELTTLLGDDWKVRAKDPNAPYNIEFKKNIANIAS